MASFSIVLIWDLRVKIMVKQKILEILVYNAALQLKKCSNVLLVTHYMNSFLKRKSAEIVVTLFSYY